MGWFKSMLIPTERRVVDVRGCSLITFFLNSESPTPSSAAVSSARLFKRAGPRPLLVRG